MGLLVEDIKASLGVSDTQMGWLMGMAFAFFYATAGLPIGYLVDRGKRTRIIIIGQIFWTIASFSCGLATRYWQLFISRFGVGVGEATLSPSAYSIVADSFPLKKIALALGVYGMGVTLGANVANLVGAWAVGLMEPGVLYELPILGERYRWQIVFFLICLPTIPLTVLMLFVKEPFRRNVKRVRGDDGEWRMAKPPKGELALYLRKNWKTVLCHNVGFAFLAFSGYGLGAWLPAFYMRVHGLTATQAGYVLGGIGVVFGTAGTVFGGWAADRLYASGYRDAKVRFGVWVSLIWLPFGLLYPLMPNVTLAVAFMIPASFISATHIGVQAAGIQEIMPNTLRGQASAIFLFFNSLIGLGLGPGALGLATDYLFGDEMKVNYSIVLVGCAAHLLAALFLYVGMKHYRKTVDELADWASVHP
jgi:MFS family permease